MNLTFLFCFCFLSPSVASNAPAESIAIVSLHECLKYAPTSANDRAILSKDIEDTDREAKHLVSQLRKLESLAKLENATDVDHLNAKLSRLEFDAFRQREQFRLSKAEQEMFKKWHKQVNAAVKVVAQREGFTVVLYAVENKNDMEVTAMEWQQLSSQTHAGFVLHQSRTDITDKIVEEMTTIDFVESFEKESEKSKQ